MSKFDFSEALVIVATAFKGVKDKGGVDYVKHLLHVAHHLKMKGYSNSFQIAGLLHDLLEDFPKDWTEERLRDKGCPEDVLEALVLLNHVKDLAYIKERVSFYKVWGISASLSVVRAKEDEYLCYVERLAGNPIARAVKIEDLIHNSDVTRLEDNDLDNPKAGRNLAKYAKALRMLTGGTVGHTK